LPPSERGQGRRSKERRKKRRRPTTAATAQPLTVGRASMPRVALLRVILLGMMAFQRPAVIEAQQGKYDKYQGGPEPIMPVECGLGGGGKRCICECDDSIADDFSTRSDLNFWSPGSAEGSGDLPDDGKENGDDEEAARCLAKSLARDVWLSCGSTPWMQARTTFVPTGATSVYPNTKQVALAAHVATRPLHGSGDGLTVDGLWGDGDKDSPTQKGEPTMPWATRKDELERGESAAAREHVQDDIGDWKAIFSYVLGHELVESEEGVLDHKPKLFNGELNIDAWVVDIFRGKRDGFFIDLAANDAVRASNTISLERLGWNGLCIEAKPRHLKGLLHRRCAVVQAVVYGTTGLEIAFDNSYACGHGCAKVLDPIGQKWPDDPNRISGQTATFRTVTLDKIVRDFRVPPVVDFLSLDLEGSETQALLTFPWNSTVILSLSLEEPTFDLLVLLYDHGLRAVKSIRSDLLCVNVEHPEYEHVMSRHRDAAALFQMAIRLMAERDGFIGGADMTSWFEEVGILQSSPITGD
jgi:hypothetical protein